MGKNYTNKSFRLKIKEIIQINVKTTQSMGVI